MNRQQLFEQICAKKSFLCVGLDTDYKKIPTYIIDECKKQYPEDEGEVGINAIFEFNKAIIDATAKYAVAYKPNMAFYEAYASAGINALNNTCIYIQDHCPDTMTIIDAKRGDIGNTSELYARAFFEGTDTFDAVTLAPYMGKDSADAFLKYPNKWAIILALTSNKSADDFETLELAGGKGPLWKEVLRKARTWGCEPHGQINSSTNEDRVMFVVGATRAETLREVREIVPDHFLLVPGVGAQGGSLEKTAEYGMNSHCGLLVNSSRGIIYAGEKDPVTGEKDPRWDSEPGFFAEAAAKAAAREAEKMAALLDRYL
ncbi:MAG: orotidine-5'-phosphate decarboxylase [Alistipes sp.]|jgi:orotidine-5'-phosphate decarboxylase|nr:orotidine-5'-phosphate decarboxylase [Alistipes sp.]